MVRTQRLKQHLSSAPTLGSPGIEDTHFPPAQEVSWNGNHGVMTDLEQVLEAAETAAPLSGEPPKL